MRVHADLYLLHSQGPQPLRLVLTDHDCVGLHLDIELQLAGVLHQFEKIAAHKDLTAAECQKENAGVRELFENALDLRGCHFPVIVVIEIAVDAALVAAIGDVEMHADRDAQLQGFLIHLIHQAHSASVGLADGLSIGSSEISRIPWRDNSSTNCSVSRRAESGSTSNSRQTFSTISASEVWPSAACQMMVATSFNVKNVESTADIIIISPPSIRAAMAELRAMYLSVIEFS